MKVKDLIKVLQGLDQDAVIEIADSYSRSEGYEGEDLENASSEIVEIRYHGGRYIIEG